MALYNAYPEILQEGQLECEALEYAAQYCFDQEASECSIAYARYIDTVNGIDVYYDFGADYYFFCPSEEA